MQHVDLIITDSGGIQEEATYLNKPLLITRENTEREEGIICGNNVLVGDNQNSIIKNAFELINNKKKFKKNNAPFGDGKSSTYIYEYLKNDCKT